MALKGEIIQIDSKVATEFLLPKHYSGRKPMISYAFGWFFEGTLQAVCTFGKPASNSLCIGICGREHSKSVYELNRLCRLDDWKEPLSQLVSTSLKLLKSLNLIIVSYADTGMNHSGYIYQATNFIYTGKTKERTDKYTEDNKHSRHYSKEDNDSLRKVRTSKHRYVYFCSSNKKLKKTWMESLKYPIEEYPKDLNKNYELGFVFKTTIVERSL